MTHLNIVFETGILLILCATSQQACGPNEITVDCAAVCEADFCPKSAKPQTCPQPVTCPPAGCKCQFNYRRADNGTCIPTEQCPPFQCGPNEVYAPCPPLCSDDCSLAPWGNGQCPPTFGFIGIVVSCTPQCRCRTGFWRKNGTCVTLSECKLNR
ncbi:late cornified envelope-like proline-rich protein 1 [Ostrinia nubilalis]|uniref:late cornified envelope-like proline-rich protein 1 n=1 Tax=Ostrinia nubilalis TaxID=29057 RepID=UPI0030824E6C